MELTSYMLGKKNGGTQPTGEIDITSNGTTDVTNYATANVNVTPNLEAKSVTITENKTTTITPTEGKDGLSSVQVTTNVSGSTPTTMAEFGNAITNTLHLYQNYLKGTIANYPTSTSEATTLYTPNETNKYYIIVKNQQGKYLAIWTAWDIARITTSSNCKFSWINIYPYGKNQSGQWSSTVPFLQEDNYFNLLGQDAQYTYYYSAFDTLTDAINGLKSNTTTYSSSLSSGVGYSTYSTDYVIPYTNMVVFDNKTSGTFTQLTSKRISSNETIEVIS